MAAIAIHQLLDHLQRLWATASHGMDEPQIGERARLVAQHGGGLDLGKRAIVPAAECVGLSENEMRSREPRIHLDCLFELRNGLLVAAREVENGAKLSVHGV